MVVAVKSNTARSPYLGRAHQKQVLLAIKEPKINGCEIIAFAKAIKSKI